jgi:tetratricopeptide (TPR) repeat protein
MRGKLAVLLAGVWAAAGPAAAPPGGLDATRRARLADLEEGLKKYAQAGQLAEAEKLARQALALRRRWQGESHWRVTAARLEAERWQQLRGVPPERRRELGEALRLLDEGTRRQDRGRHAEAEEVLRQAMKTFRALLGEDHPETARSCAGVAYNLGAQGKSRLAQPLYEKALALRRKALGEAHPDTATSYNGLAFNLQAQGEYAQARALYEKALAIRLRVLGEEHPDTATSYNNLAFILGAAQGKGSEAQRLYEKALAIRLRVLGEEHPHTAGSYNNVAFNLDQQGKYAQAQPLYRKALRISRKVLGERHPGTAISYNNAGYNLHGQRKHSQALPPGSTHTFQGGNRRGGGRGAHRAVI